VGDTIIIIMSHRHHHAAMQRRAVVSAPMSSPLATGEAASTTTTTTTTTTKDGVDATANDYYVTTLREPVPRTLACYGVMMVLGLVYLGVFFAFGVYEIYAHDLHVEFRPFGHGGWMAVTLVLLLVFALPATLAYDWEFYWRRRALLVRTKRVVRFEPSGWQFWLSESGGQVHLFCFVSIALVAFVFVDSAPAFFGALTVLTPFLLLSGLLTLVEALAPVTVVVSGTIASRTRTQSM